MYLGTGSESCSAAQQQGPGKSAVPPCNQRVPCKWDDSVVHPQDAFTTRVSYTRDLNFVIPKDMPDGGVCNKCLILCVFWC